MKNVINWTVGSFFRTIGRIIAYVAIGAIIAFAFSYKPKAATLTSKAVYTEGYWYKSDFNNWGSNNTFNYGEAPLSTNGKAYYDIGTINTTYSGQAYQLAFGFQYNLTAQKYYDITFNFKSRDLTSNLNTTGVNLVSGSTSSTLYDTNVLSLIGVTNNATVGNNTNKLVIRIYAVQPITYWALELSSDPNNLTSVNNFGIASITIDEVDTTNSQEIINNQTNNTQNIINNQNNTTQQIIDNQNNLFGTKCSNLYNGNITSTNQSLGTFEPNTTYYFSFAESTSGYNIRAGQGGTLLAYCTTNTCQFTTDSTGNVFFNGWSFTPPLTKVMLSKSTSVYCEYGTYSNKIEDTLTDDTTNDSDISNALDNIDVPQTSYGPFQAFLTIPLQWVQTILATGQTCQTLHLPLPFVNKDLDLPCMTDFWNATGVLGVLIQALWIAVVAVRIFNGLFMLTVETLNTNPDSAMELTKIKSWEL